MTKIRLTDIAVQKLRPPTKGRSEIQDEIMPKLFLRITPNGHKSWAVAYRYNGKQKRLTLGEYPAVSILDARQAARDAMQLVAKGEDPHYLKKEKIEAQKIYTFAAVVEEYFERYAKVQTRNWLSVMRLIHAHAVPVWGDMPIGNIKRRDVIALIDKVDKRGKPSTTRILFASIRRVFNWAAERDLIEFSPCANIKNPNKANSRDRVLKDDEILAIWNACGELGAPYGTLIRFLLVTAQRVGEASKLRWKELDLKENVWLLPRERVKSKRSHEVPLSPLALELLHSLPSYVDEDGSQQEHYLFTTTGGKKPFSGFSKYNTKLNEKSGVTGWRIHDLRRTAATNLAKLGVADSTISHVLNHAPSGVTAIYNRHSYLPQKREALEKWGQKVSQIVNTNS